ncbi:MAG: hypothetical protein JOS17DRAFT_738327 [Linnemannia elongata]|nr:MAG: hypothetical protein JOS17DRAFT_738327 [Linnemannia elongata]
MSINSRNMAVLSCRSASQRQIALLRSTCSSMEPSSQRRLPGVSLLCRPKVFLLLLLLLVMLLVGGGGQEMAACSVVYVDQVHLSQGYLTSLIAPSCISSFVLVFVLRVSST